MSYKDSLSSQRRLAKRTSKGSQFPVHVYQVPAGSGTAYTVSGSQLHGIIVATYINGERVK